MINNTQIMYDLKALTKILNFLNSEAEVAFNTGNRKESKAYYKLYDRLKKVYIRTHDRAFPATEV